MIGLHNPVTAGKELTYEIRVVNQGAVAYPDIRVTATLPEGLRPVALGTVGPGGAKVRIEGRTIRFDPVEIAAGARWASKFARSRNGPANAASSPNLPLPV